MADRIAPAMDGDSDSASIDDSGGEVEHADETGDGGGGGHNDRDD